MTSPPNWTKLIRILDGYIDNIPGRSKYCIDGGRDITLPHDFICCTGDGRIRMFCQSVGITRTTYYDIDSVIDAISVKYSDKKQKL